MGTVCFSETLASTDESTRRRNPEEQHRHPPRRENLQSSLSCFQKPATGPCSFHFLLYNDKMKTYEMGGACSRHEEIRWRRTLDSKFWDSFNYHICSNPSLLLVINLFWYFSHCENISIVVLWIVTPYILYNTTRCHNPEDHIRNM
jgi:hypothetical protein